MEKLDFLYPQCDLWPFHYLPSDSFIMSQSFVGLSKHNYQIGTLPIAVIYFFWGGQMKISILSENNALYILNNYVNWHCFKQG